MKTTKPLLALIFKLSSFSLKFFFHKTIIVTSLNNGLYLLRIKNNSDKTPFIQRIVVQH